MRFIGRTMELKRIRAALTMPRGTVLLYGKRRVGKTTLIKEAIKPIDAVKILYTCMPIELSRNAEDLSAKAMEALGFPAMRFSNFPALFDFLKTRSERIIVILDEYQDLKKKKEDGEYVDALFRTIIDDLGENISILLSGSAIRVMQELNKYDNPLYERFREEISLDELTYIEASEFYPDCPTRDKIIYYSVFGGMPLLNERIDPSLGVNENIIRLFVDQNGTAYSYAKSVLDIEASSINDAFIILSRIGNGKMRYSEIETLLASESTRKQLSRTLKTLVDSKLIRKRQPINSDSRKTAFYEISSNSLRFFLAYLLLLMPLHRAREIEQDSREKDKRSLAFREEALRKGVQESAFDALLFLGTSLGVLLFEFGLGPIAWEMGFLMTLAGTLLSIALPLLLLEPCSTLLARLFSKIKVEFRKDRESGEPRGNDVLAKKRGGEPEESVFIGIND